MTTETATLMTVQGVAARIVARRRYGNTTFTWVEFTDPAGISHWFHDPWPSIVPRRSAVEAQCVSIAADFEAGTLTCRCGSPT